MAQSVSLPSKQVTTAAVVNQGSAIKYPTGVAFSQINITFQMPRSQRTRSIFERWIQLISSDADQYVDFYEDYCCPQVRIYKLERGGGDLAGGPGDLAIWSWTLPGRGRWWRLFPQRPLRRRRARHAPPRVATTSPRAAQRTNSVCLWSRTGTTWAPVASKRASNTTSSWSTM